MSNPPYIALSEATSLPASVRDWEPAVALFSGGDGLAATARLVREAAAVLEPGGLFAIEVDARRASLAAELVASERRFHAVRVELDLAGRERFVLARRLDNLPLEGAMIEDKAKELGRLIGQSNEYKEVKRASDALNEDKDTVGLLQKMEQLRVDAQRMLSARRAPDRGDGEGARRAARPDPGTSRRISACSSRRRTSTRRWRA